MLREIGGKRPRLARGVFVAETAVLAGDVVLGEHSSVWYGAVVRGDLNRVEVGRHSNIQDGCVLHVTEEHGVRVGDYVTVGHGAVLHGCRVQNGALIGMGAIVLDGAVVEEEALVGAGALVPEGKVIPARSLALGSPAKVVRELSPEQVQGLRGSAITYERLWKELYQADGADGR